MGKKGKKGKKGKGAAEVEIVTTRETEFERARCMCPRLGDNFARVEKTVDIKMDITLRQIRKAALKESTTLILSGMALTSVPEEITQRPELTKLTTLDLSRNQLFNSHELFPMLATLHGLKNLDLSRNFLNGTMSNALKDLAALESLKLDENQLQALPPEVARWLYMKHFSAAHNQLTTLPAGLANWHNLETLNLRFNKITALPDTGGWTKLKKLWLGHNALREVDVSGLAALEELDLLNNAVSEVPADLGLCTNLKHLLLGQNSIKSIPSEILGNLVQLRSLDLYKNKIESLPPEVGNCTLIQRLSLASNNIRDLPSEIGHCVGMRELYVSNNPKLSKIPESVGHLATLRELSMRNCKALKTLPASLSTGCTSLRELDLRMLPKPKDKKMPADLVQALEDRKCRVLGVKKGKAKKGKK